MKQAGIVENDTKQVAGVERSIQYRHDFLAKRDQIVQGQSTIGGVVMEAGMSGDVTTKVNSNSLKLDNRVSHIYRQRDT